MKILICPNFKKSHSFSATSEACEILLSLGCEVMMPSDCSESLFLSGVRYLDSKVGAALCDVMISVGGDGTILKCAKLASAEDKPLLGINCGRLGFMATLEREDLSRLEKLISGDFSVEQRMMLSAEIDYTDGRKASLCALNEAVISSEYGSGIRDFTVLADGLTVSSLRADGLIFSTPTGASAYSLSAGGPLIEPALDCIEFTQICPHSLFARTMLFSPDKLIEIKFKSDGGASAALSVDGQKPLRISENDRLRVFRSPRRLKLIDINGDGFFRAVNRKLMAPAKQPDDSENGSED